MRTVGGYSFHPEFGGAGHGGGYYEKVYNGDQHYKGDEAPEPETREPPAAEFCALLAKA